MKMKIVAALACLTLVSAAAAPQNPPAQQERKEPSPQSIVTVPPLTVTIPNFPAEGLILDVGGGGEGVIGQLKTTQVVAIDLSRRELEDAPPGPLLKIVMDARELKFLDATFPTATVFFTFMYMDAADHPKAFAELFRVLKPGGRLLVWDVLAPQAADAVKEWALYPLTVNLPSKTIKTGYGVRLPKEGRQGLPYFTEVGKAAGFEVKTGTAEGSWFYLELSKPQK